MNDKADTLETRMQALNARAATQRERFLGTLDVLRQQAHPARLKEHAGNRLLDRMLNALSRGRSAVTMHPARALGIAAQGGGQCGTGALVVGEARAQLHELRLGAGHLARAHAA